MTAEIAVLNKHGLALAADSAVTIGAEDRNKIYNNANKLFALSKYHPVGIMVYNSASYMGIPWETVVKSYRAHLGQTNFKYVEEFAKDFLEFLKRLCDKSLCVYQSLFSYIFGWYQVQIGVRYFYKISEDFVKA